MRHRVAGRKLGRNASHRKAMFRNMATSLIRTVRIVEGEVGQPKVAGRIITTVPKAKELRKSDQGRSWVNANASALALRRRAFSELRDDLAVDILFDDLAKRFADRDGGYTRIVRLATVRLGDAGQQALIEFVGERDRTKSKKRAAPAVEPVGT